MRRYTVGLVAGWTLVTGLFIALNIQREMQQAHETALTQARSVLQRDIIYREWNAHYGPLYASVTKGILPNQYLSDMPDRDVTTSSGRTFTQVNPAYMTRLVFEIAARDHGVKGHITSLHPVRPGNAPDAWETKGLKAFEAGSTEEWSVEKMDGADHFRMMKPLVTDQECLQCHRQHGYEAGDIRGGISIAVPMEPLYSISRKHIRVGTLSMLALWFIGLTGIMVGARQLNRTIRLRDKAEAMISALNRELMQQKTELESANRELDSFSYSVSHDLRSPVSTAGAFAHLIQEVPADKHSDKCAHYAGIISQECSRMEKLIQTLFEFSRFVSREVTRTTVDLSSMAKEIAAGLERSGPDRPVKVLIQDGIHASGDHDLLRVVLQNLLGNAWKYTGKIETAVIEFGAIDQEGQRTYFVRDNGAGFDPSQADRIFEAFHRLHSSRDFPGTGIGLATVKRIIRRHGGRIWAEGDPGKGAIFRFTLP